MIPKEKTGKKFLRKSYVNLLWDERQMISVVTEKLTKKDGLKILYGLKMAVKLLLLDFGEPKKNRSRK